MTYIKRWGKSLLLDLSFISTLRCQTLIRFGKSKKRSVLGNISLMSRCGQEDVPSITKSGIGRTCRRTCLQDSYRILAITQANMLTSTFQGKRPMLQLVEYS